MNNLLNVTLNVIISFMLFSCFGQNSSTNYEKKKQKFTEKILKNNWSQPHKIKALVEPSIVVSYGRNKIIGASKYGGTPDLPKDVEWPKFKGHSMVFYAQINLSEIAVLHQDNLLPQTGMLYFFSYFQNPEGDYGAEYDFQKDESEYKVIYIDGETTQLLRTKFPKDLIKAYRFKSKPIDFYLNFQIPPTTYTWVYENTNLNATDEAIYEELITDYSNCQEDLILGTPCPIQSGADYDWAYSYTNLTDLEDPLQKAAVDKVRPEFINLLSFGMNDKFDSIGYSNCYFGITKKDLKNRAFENVVFIMQDT